MSDSAPTTSTYLPPEDGRRTTAPLAAPIALTRPATPTVTAGPRPGPIALVAGADELDAEMVDLLRRRLRQIVLLFLAAYVAFLIRDLLTPRHEQMWLQMATFLVVTTVQILLVGVTWSAWASTLPRLRVIEWAALGLCWLTIGSIQFEWLCDWAYLEPYLVGNRGVDGQILVANTWAVAWFAIIAGYPVIVPNSARRALLLALLMATAPFLVTLAAMTRNPLLTGGRVVMMFVQYTIWCSLAVGIAVYGSHQAGMLRRQASEAQRFGQYRLSRRLGGGGMGEVFLAEHLLLKRPSVVKTIRPERARDPAVIRRFEREVRILATLTHWNTVAVFDYGYTADGTFYYVMEYLPGMDLNQLVEQHGPLPAGRAVHLVRQVCAALREAHAVGLIHRDVKPGNVMVCRRGGVPDVAKLLDFGLVHAIDPVLASGSDASRLTREGMIMGTPAFMSPEQGAGKPLDARSDVYSVGVTAYFLLTGVPPFRTGGVMEIIAAHLLEKPKSPREVKPDVPADLDAVVVRCLAKDPKERFATVAELDAALQCCGCSADWDERQAADWWDRRDGRNS